MPYSAGTVFLQVVPSYRNLMRQLSSDAPEIQKALGESLQGPEADKAAAKAGERIGEQIGKGAAKTAPAAGQKAGDKYAGAFATAVKKGAAAAQKELSAIKVDVNDRDAKRKLADLQRRTKALSNAKIGVNLDAAAAVAEVAALRASLAALREGAEIDVDFNAAAAEAGLAAFEKRLEALKPEIEVEIDTGKADKQLGLFKTRFQKQMVSAANVLGDSVGDELAKIRARMLQLGDTNLNLDLNAKDAEAEAKRLIAELRAADGKNVEIDVKTNIAQAILELKAIENQGRRTARSADDSANSFRAFNAVILGAVTLGPALVPILGAIAGGLTLIGPLALAAAGGLGVMILGFSGVGNAVSAMGQAQQDAAKDTKAAAETMRTATQAVADAERNLARARADAARAAEDASRATSRAIADANQANQDAARATADAERQAAEAVEDAIEAVADARANARDVAIQSEQAVTDARRAAAQADAAAARAVADAREAGADQIESALEQERQAQEALRDAVDSVAEAEQNLRDARAAAAAEQADLADQQRQNALDERNAVIEMFEATVNRNATMNDPGATNLEREQADIRYEQAKLDLEEIREREVELGKERRKADREGVNGSEQVQDAQAQLLEAIEAQKQAEKDLADAARNTADVRVEAQQAVNEALRAQARIAREGNRNIAQALADQAEAQKDATEAIRDALEAEREARQDGARSIRDARRAEVRAAQDGTQAINDARRNERRVAEDNARSISDARRNLRRAERDYQDALKQTEEVGSASQEALREAMEKLSPAGRKFARFIFSLRDEFKRLRAAAAAGLLPGVQSMLERLIDRYFPSFVKWIRRMSGVLGGLFEEAGRRFTKDGGAFEAFFGMLEKLGPRFMRQFGRMTLNWLETFAALMTTAAPSARKFSDALLQLSRNARDWANSEKGTEDFQQFLDYVARVGPKVWDFFKSLGRALLNIGEAVSPFGEVILGAFTRFFNFIAGMDKDILGPIVIAILILVAAFQTAALVIAGVSGLFSVLGGAAIFAGLSLGAIVAILVVVAGALFVLWTQSETFRNVVKGAFRAVGRAIEFVWTKVIKPVLGALGKAFTFVWREFIKPVLNAIGDIFGYLWKEVVKPILGYIWDRWKEVWAGVKWVWKNVLQPVIEAIAKIIGWLWKEVFRPVMRYIGEHVRNIFEAIAWVHKNILAPVFELIFKGLMYLWRSGFKWAFEKIGDAWDWVTGHLRDVWRDVLKPIFSAIMGVLEDHVVPAFKNAVQRIGNIWDGLKAIAAKPVKFLIETVLNDGLIAAFNWVAEKVGADKLGEIPLPSWIENGDYATGGTVPTAGRRQDLPGFAYGGVLPGRSVNQDNMVIGVAGGEAVMRQEWTDVMGRGYVDSMNRAARLYGRRGVEEMMGAWQGGITGYRNAGVVERGDKRDKIVWPTVGRATSTYEDHTGVDINQPPGNDRGEPIFAFRDGKITYVGWDRGYGDAVFQNTVAGEVVYGHMDPSIAKAGQFARAGDVLGYVGETGNAQGAHLHFGLANGGTYHNAMALLAGARHVGKQAGMYVPGGGGGVLPDWAASILDGPIEWMVDKMSDGLDALSNTFGDNPFIDLVTAVPKLAAEKAKDWLLGEVEGYSKSFVPRGGVASLAGNFGSGADAVWKSLMSTGVYSARQAAGIMGNMYYESGFDHNIVQGGGYSRSPAGIGSGYGLVQWTPGTKLGSYIGMNTTTTVANSIDALTAQLRGKGAHAEGEAGRQFFATDSIQGAAKSFELDYERHAGGAQPQRWAMAQRIFDKYAFKNGKSKGGIINPGEGVPVEGAPTGLYDNGGILPPGLSNVVNLTGGDEHMAVFTEDQWRHIGQAGSGHNIDIDVNGTDLSPHDVADELLFALRHADRGGRYGGNG